MTRMLTGGGLAAVLALAAVVGAWLYYGGSSPAPRETAERAVPAEAEVEVEAVATTEPATGTETAAPEMAVGPPWPDGTPSSAPPPAPSPPPSSVAQTRPNPGTERQDAGLGGGSAADGSPSQAPSAPEPPAAPDPVTPAVDEAPAEAEGGTGATAAVSEEPAPAQAEGDIAEAVPPEDGADVPRFDVVRVDASGQIIVAGHAAPGREVEILLDGEVLAKVMTDGSGAFAAVISAALSDQARELQLRVPADDPAGEVAGEPGPVETAETPPLAAPDELTPAGTRGTPATAPSAADAGDSVARTPAPAQGPSGADATSAPALARPTRVPEMATTSDSADRAERPTATDRTADDATAEAADDTAGDAPAPLEQAEPTAARALPSAPDQPATRPSGASGTQDTAARSTPTPTSLERPAEIGTIAAAPPPNPSNPSSPASPSRPAERPGALLSAPVIILPATDGERAPSVLRRTEDRLELVQPSQGDVRGVLLDTVTYADTGEVLFSGRGRTERVIRVYGNAESLGEAPVARDGTWLYALGRREAEPIELLRFDEVDASGSVTSRIETPFRYAGDGSEVSPQVLRERRIVVQRGDYLWRIAEQFYGEGIRYSLIYTANDDLIRDPDLIYPGQVFAIPELVDAE